MKNLTICLCLLLSFQASRATPMDTLNSLSIDSLFTLLEEQVYENKTTFLALAYYGLGQALHQKEDAAAARIHGILSFWHYFHFDVNNVDSCIHHRLKQIEYDEKIGNTEEVGKGYIDLAIDFMNTNELTKAQEALFKAIDRFESLNDEVKLAEAHANLATLSVEMNKYHNALYFAKLSFSVLREANDYFMMADVSFNGFYKAYMALEDYPKALKHINDAIQLCNTHQFDQYEDMLVEFYHSKAKALLEQQKFILADSFYHKAWALEKQHNNRNIAERHRYGIGEVLYRQEKYAAALPHLVAGVEALEAATNFEPVYYKTLATCYEKLARYQDALKYSTKAFDWEQKTMKDQITNLESEALVKYETGRKDQQLQEQAQIIQQKNWIQWLSIGATTLLAILLSTLFYFFRKNQKTNALVLEKNHQIEERNQQNELLLKEIHHRVKNNLQVISSLLNFQSRSIDDKGIKMALLDSQSRVQSMSLIHQKLYRGQHLAAVEMKSYLGNLAESLIDAYADEEDVNVEISMDKIELDVDYAIPLGLIANELVTNSLKYAFPDERKGAIHIQLQQQDNDLVLKVTDNGVGKSGNKTQAPNGGFGSELIEMFSLQLKGALEQTSDNGYQTLFRFPYLKVA